MELDLADLGALDGQPATFAHPSKRNPTPLDDARGAVHRYTAAQRLVRGHVADGGADREAANASLDAKIEAMPDAALAARVFQDCIDRVAVALMTGVHEADLGLEDGGANAATVLKVLRDSMLGMARALNA